MVLWQKEWDEQRRIIQFLKINIVWKKIKEKFFYYSPLNGGKIPPPPQKKKKGELFSQRMYCSVFFCFFFLNWIVFCTGFRYSFQSRGAILFCKICRFLFFSHPQLAASLPPRHARSETNLNQNIQKFIIILTLNKHNFRQLFVTKTLYCQLLYTNVG